MKLSMCVITHNEAKNIKTCFDSWWDDVDEVVMVDDGSTDATIQAAQAYAKDKMQKGKLIIDRFREPSEEFTDDFSALRNRADELATGDWRTWCDLDDIVIGLGNLRKVVEEASPDVYQFYARYEYALDAQGACFCELWRERMVRATGPSEGWVGRVHECQAIPPPMMMVDRDVAVWRHLSKHESISDRNEKLLWKWVEEEPANARALSYLAYELMSKRVDTKHDGKVVGTQPDYDALKNAIPIFQRYLQIPGEAAEHRAQATRRMAQAFMVLGMHDAAYETSVPMLAEAPQWSDTKLTLAEVAHERQDWGKTIEFANQVFKQGIPETTLIINPLDYTLRPMVLMASAFAELGELEEAVKTAQQVVAQHPDYMGTNLQLQRWLVELAQEQAAGTWVNCTQLLLAHDEPEKAEILLATVPFFAADHPAIISARVMVDQALQVPYQTEIVGDSGRGQFIVRGIKEQIATAEREAKRVVEEREQREKEEAEPQHDPA